MRSRVLAEVRSLAGRDEVEGALEIVGFDPEEMADRRIDDLSGGQQRLVLLAGLIARACDVVILDEPLAGLDAPARERLAHGVETLMSRGTGVVVISHDPDWALGRADSVVDLDRLAVGWGQT
jgi:energy-coupling factor transport system ATP-binding protein